MNWRHAPSPWRWVNRLVVVLAGSLALDCLLKERKDGEEFLARGLRAVLADFKSFGALDGLAFHVTKLGDQFGPEPLGLIAVPLLRALAGPGQPRLLVLGHLFKIVDAGRFLVQDSVDRHDHVGLERIWLPKAVGRAVFRRPGEILQRRALQRPIWRQYLGSKMTTSAVSQGIFVPDLCRIDETPAG